VQAEAQDAQDDKHAFDVLEQLRACNTVAWECLRAARDGQDHGGVLRALDRLQRQLEFQSRLLGQLDERPQLNVLISPQWQQVRGALLLALEPYPQLRGPVSQRLLALESGE
jgi:hypothetical protein